MTTRRSASLTLLGLLALALPSAADPTAEAGWKAGNKGQGHGYAYQAFSQQKEGEPVRRLRGRRTVRGVAGVARANGNPVAADPAPGAKDQTRRVISHTDQETVLHTSIDLPMMFTDRDIVTRGVSSSDPKTGIRRIDFKSIDHPAAPPREGVIRLTKSGGFWEFVPDGAKRSKVTFETYVD